MAETGPHRTAKISHRFKPYARPKSKPVKQKSVRDRLRHRYDLPSAPFRCGFAHHDQDVKMTGDARAEHAKISQTATPPPAPNASQQPVPHPTGSQSTQPAQRTAAVDDTNVRLARFFAYKGDRPLTDMEAAGVFALMKGARKHPRDVDATVQSSPISEPNSRGDSANTEFHSTKRSTSPSCSATLDSLDCIAGPSTNALAHPFAESSSTSGLSTKPPHGAPDLGPGKPMKKQRLSESPRSATAPAMPSSEPIISVPAASTSSTSTVSTPARVGQSTAVDASTTAATGPSASVVPPTAAPPQDAPSSPAEGSRPAHGTPTSPPPQYAPAGSRDRINDSHTSPQPGPSNAVDRLAIPLPVVSTEAAKPWSPSQSPEVPLLQTPAVVGPEPGPEPAEPPPYEDDVSQAPMVLAAARFGVSARRLKELVRPFGPLPHRFDWADFCPTPGPEQPAAGITRAAFYQWHLSMAWDRARTKAAGRVEAARRVRLDAVRRANQPASDAVMERLALNVARLDLARPPNHIHRLPNPDNAKALAAARFGVSVEGLDRMVSPFGPVPAGFDWADFALPVGERLGPDGTDQRDGQIQTAWRRASRTAWWRLELAAQQARRDEARRARRAREEAETRAREAQAQTRARQYLGSPPKQLEALREEERR